MPRIKQLTVTYDDGTVETLTPPQAAVPAPAPVPVITASRVEVMAGLPVHVHGLDSTLGVGQPHQAVYAWDFGDSGGRYNTLRGFNAAHVYDTPGSYTITLTVTNVGGTSATVTQTVTVQPAKINPIRRLEDAKSDCRNILAVPVIERTSTWWPKIRNATVEGVLGGTKLVYVGREANAGIVSLPDECDDLVLRGLAFDSAVDRAGVVRAVGVYQQKARLAVIDCTGLRLESFVKSESRTASGLLVMECSALMADGISGYFAWVSCSDAVIVGNTVANVTREHVVRMGYYSRVLVAHNEFANLDRRPGDPGDLSKGCIVAQRGSYVWISGNHCQFGGIGIGPLGGRDGLSDAGGLTQSAVVEQNTVDGGNAIVLSNGSQHVMVRENVIDRGAADLSGIEVLGPDAAYPGRVSMDLAIYGNRQYRVGDIAPAVRVDAGIDGSQIHDNVVRER